MFTHKACGFSFARLPLVPRVLVGVYKRSVEAFFGRSASCRQRSGLMIQCNESMRYVLEGFAQRGEARGKFQTKEEETPQRGRPTFPAANAAGGSDGEFLIASSSLCTSCSRTSLTCYCVQVKLYHQRKHVKAQPPCQHLITGMCVDHLTIFKTPSKASPCLFLTPAL